MSQDKIIGTVGALQFEVIQYRLEHEYGAKCRFEPVNYMKACWLNGNKNAVEEFINSRRSQIGQDIHKRFVFFSETQWSLDREIQEHSDIQFSFSAELN